MVMNTAIQVFALASLLMSLAIAQVLLRKGLAAAQKFNILVAAVLCVPLLPLLLRLPVLELQVLGSNADTIPPVLFMLASACADAADVLLSKLNTQAAWLLPAVFLIYLVGLSAALGKVALSCVFLCRMRQQSKPVTDYQLHNFDSADLHNVRICEVDGLATPLTFGVFRKTIFLPTGLKSQGDYELEAVLRHELAHIRRSDCLLRLATTTVFALLWFHPLVPYLRRAIDFHAELAADDQALLDGMDSCDYAEALLGFASRHSPQSQHHYLLAAAFWLPRWSKRQRIDSVLAAPHRLRSDRSKLVEQCALTVFFLVALSSLQFSQAATYVVPSDRSVQDLDVADLSNGLIIACPGFVLPEPGVAPDFHKVHHTFHAAAANFDLPNNQRLHADYRTASPQLASTVAIPEPSVQIRGLIPQRSAAPVYPQRAIRRGIEGFVIVEFSIDELGRVESPRVVQSKPKRIFDSAALKAVKQYRYAQAQHSSTRIVGVQNKFVFQIGSKIRDFPEPDNAVVGPTMIALGERYEY